MVSLGCGGGRGIRELTYHRGENLFNVAERYFAQGKIDEAETLYNEYLRLKPGVHTADNTIFRLGEIAVRRKDYERSFEFFQKMIRMYPESELLPSAKFNAALSLFLNADWQNALHALLSFQMEFPLSQYEPEVKYMLSEIYFRKREYKNAKETANAFLGLYPDSKFRGKVLYILGLTEMYIDETEQSTRHLMQALSGELSLVQRQNVLYTLGTISLMQDDVYTAVKHFSDLVKFEEADDRKERIIRKIEGLLKNQFRMEFLIKLIEDNPDEFPSDLALLEAGDREYKEGNLADAIYYWRLFLERFPKHKNAPFIKKMLSLYQGRGERDVVYGQKFGCIAPLSGPLSEYGEKMLKGIKMALEEYNQKFGTSIKLILFDSQAKPDMAKQGVELLASQDNVSAIIGPLLTSTAMAASSVAEQFGIPLFTPTATGEGLTEKGRYIFRNCLTNSHQTSALARYAVEVKGMQSFGILFPFNPYGQEMMKLFAGQVEELGGHVDIIEFYEPQDTDFKEQLLRIHSVNPEALFLPDSYEKIVLIAPQLHFYEPDEADPNDPNHINTTIEEDYSEEIFGPYIDHDLQYQQEELGGEMAYLDANELDIFDTEISPGPDGLDIPFGDTNYEVIEYEKEERPIQLFGTDGWFDYRLIKEGGDYVDGAIFSVGFYPDSSDQLVKEFVSKFTERFGYQPDLVSAQSYDAMNILLEASDGGKLPWDLIWERLLHIKDYPGVSGRTSILLSGDSDKDVTLLEIKGKRLVPVEKFVPNQSFEIEYY